MDDLKARIMDACHAVTHDEIQKAVYQIYNHSQLVVQQDGGHIEQFL